MLMTPITKNSIARIFLFFITPIALSNSNTLATAYINQHISNSQNPNIVMVKNTASNRLMLEKTIETAFFLLNIIANKGNTANTMPGKAQPMLAGIFPHLKLE